MENERDQPTDGCPSERNNVRYLDEWRAQHRRYYAAKTEALRGRRQRRVQTGKRPATGHGSAFPGAYSSSTAVRPPGTVSNGSFTASPAPLRRWTWALWCLPLAAGLAVWLSLARGDKPEGPPGETGAAPVLQVWAMGARGQDAELHSLLRVFEDTHGVSILWQAGPAEPWELIHALTVGSSPDVILADHDMILRLVAMNALLPLVPPEEGEPAHYTLPLGEETMWVRALRAAVPARSRHPELARNLVAFLASAAGADPRAGIQ